MRPLRLRWVLLGAALAGGGAAGLAKGDAGDRLAAAARDASAGVGLTIGEVWVAGRRQTERFALIRVLASTVGRPSLFVDLDAVAEAVREINGVRDAEVRVRLPGQLRVVLRERVPAAVWQTGGRLYSIDGSGHVIRPVAAGDRPGLPLVVGDGANTRLGDLEGILDAWPGFAPHVAAAIRVSRRRWTLQTTTGITLHLPEHAPAAALARLSVSLGSLEVLPPGVAVVDLRVRDRLFVRMRAAGRGPHAGEGV